MMTEPRWGTGGIVQTQGSSLREQPWALRRNSVGVEYIDNSDQCQISSNQVLRTVENIGVAVAAPLMEFPILDFKNASQRCLKGRTFPWSLDSSKGTIGPSGLMKILVGSIPGPNGPGWVNYGPFGPLGRKPWLNLCSKTVVPIPYVGNLSFRADPSAQPSGVSHSHSATLSFWTHGSKRAPHKSRLPCPELWLPYFLRSPNDYSEDANFTRSTENTVR